MIQISDNLESLKRTTLRYFIHIYNVARSELSGYAELVAFSKLNNIQIQIFYYLD